MVIIDLFTKKLKKKYKIIEKLGVMHMNELKIHRRF